MQWKKKTHQLCLRFIPWWLSQCLPFHLISWSSFAWIQSIIPWMKCSQHLLLFAKAREVQYHQLHLRSNTASGWFNKVKRLVSNYPPLSGGKLWNTIVFQLSNARHYIHKENGYFLWLYLCYSLGIYSFFSCKCMDVFCYFAFDFLGVSVYRFQSLVMVMVR